ncbi:thioesterase [Bermanella sp. 47_1433_sub80_T6]|nr:thioesterase [Bermanella sp. 47_1433_sub80_T6]
MNVEIESKYQLDYKVQSKDLAKELSIHEGDNFPEVFATSRMVALMELAAARLMKPLLGVGELSVGVNVNVNHIAATPNNEMVQSIATFKGMEGKLYKFQVDLYDNGGKAGSGTHTRAIVKTERLLQGAQDRVKA